MRLTTSSKHNEQGFVEKLKLEKPLALLHLVY